MKKVFSFFALLAVILLASCSKQPQGASLVPDDATFVLRVDIAKCAKQAGLGKGSSKLVDQLKGQVSSLVENKDLQSKITAIIDDPSKSGIDLSEPIFAYVSGNLEKNPRLALVGAVSSQDKLSSLLEDVLKEVGEGKLEEADGAKYLAEDDAAFIFTPEWFFIGATDNAKSTISELNDRANGKGSLSGHKAMERLCAQDGMLQVLILGEGIASVNQSAEVAKMLPEGLKLRDMASLISLNMAKGEATLSSETIALSKEWEDYTNKVEKALKPITKDQVKYISDKGLSMLVNLDLSDAGQWIDQLATMFNATEEHAEDIAKVKKIIAGFDGTLALDFYGLNEDNNMPLMAIYAGTKDSAPLDAILAEAGDIDELQETGDHMYQVPMDYDYDYDDETGDYSRTPTKYGAFGFKQGQTYFSTNAEGLFVEPANAYPFSAVKGKGFFMRFNFGMIDDLASNFGEGGEAIAKEVARHFDYAEMYIEDGGYRSVLRLVTKDKEKTPLESILSLIEENL
jgi:hypothetical protein